MQPEIQCFGHYAGGLGLNQIDQFGHGITQFNSQEIKTSG